MCKRCRGIGLDQNNSGKKRQEANMPAIWRFFLTNPKSNPSNFAATARNQSRLRCSSRIQHLE
jgi:hypothetical protein